MACIYSRLKYQSLALLLLVTKCHLVENNQAHYRTQRVMSLQTKSCCTNLEQAVGVQWSAGDSGHFTPVRSIASVGHTHVHHLQIIEIVEKYSNQDSQHSLLLWPNFKQPGIWKVLSCLDILTVSILCIINQIQTIYSLSFILSPAALLAASILNSLSQRSQQPLYYLSTRLEIGIMMLYSTVDWEEMAWNLNPF